MLPRSMKTCMEMNHQSSVKLIVEELLEHTLNGAPTPPATPNRLRKANKDIICLCDSGSNDDIRQQNKKPAASSKKSSKKSRSLDEQNNKDEENKDNEDAQDSSLQRLSPVQTFECLPWNWSSLPQKSNSTIRCFEPKCWPLKFNDPMQLRQWQPSKLHFDLIPEAE